MPFHHHDHDVNLDSMYKQEWVQNLIRQLMDWFRANTDWIGLDGREPKRVLDYACGNGTISIAIAQTCKNITFRGIDSSPSQIEKFNDMVQENMGNDEDRFVAAVGDISKDPPDLRGDGWFDLDAAVTSMALHHFPDPVVMLKHLRQRVRKGGAVVIADWLAGDATGTEPEHGASFHPAHNHDPRTMLEVVGRQRVWSGFTKESIKDCFEAAGLIDFEFKLDPERSSVPEEFGGDKQIFYAKGIVC